MAEKSFPLENTMYTAEDAQLWFATRTSGVYADGHLGVSADGTMNLTLYSGIAWMHYDQFAGCVYANTDSLILPVEMSDASFNRIDRVCIRLEMLNNTCYAYIKKGTAASAPVPPELQRDNVAYEISVAQILVGVGVTAINAGDITDERLDADVCGLMSDGVTGIDTSVIQAQFRDMLQQLHDENVMRDPGVLRIDEIMSLTEVEKGNVYTSLGLDEESLGGMKKELLWTNASPVSAFGEQSLTLLYDQRPEILEIHYIYNKNAIYAIGVSYIAAGVGDNGTGSYIISFDPNASFVSAHRYVSVTCADGEMTVRFGNGARYSSYGGGKTLTGDIVIPYKIYACYN